MKWKKYTVLLPKGTVPGQLFVVSWGTILQLYHKPTKHTFELGIYVSGQHNKFKYQASNDIKTYWKYPHLKENRQDSNLPWDIVVQTNINARVLWYLQVQILDGTCHHDRGCKTAVEYCKCPDKAIKNIPAEGDLSQSPTHKHLSGCSVFKYKNKLMFSFNINIQVTKRKQNWKHKQNQWFYLLLRSKNDIHEVHVLEGTVLSSFYHLSSKIQRLFLKSEKIKPKHS